MKSQTFCNDTLFHLLFVKYAKKGNQWTKKRQNWGTFSGSRPLFGFWPAFRGSSKHRFSNVFTYTGIKIYQKLFKINKRGWKWPKNNLDLVEIHNRSELHHQVGMHMFLHYNNMFSSVFDLSLEILWLWSFPNLFTLIFTLLAKIFFKYYVWY